MNTQQPLKTTGNLIGLAIWLALIMAIVIVAGNGFFKALQSGTSVWPAIILLTIMALTWGGALVNAFIASIAPSFEKLASTVGSGCLALVSGLEVSHQLGEISGQAYFTLSLISQVVLTFCFTDIMCRFLKVEGRILHYPAFATSGAVALLGLGALLSQSWIALTDIPHLLGLVRDVGLALAPCLLLIACTLSRGLRLNPRSIKESLVLRLPSETNDGARRKAFFMMLAGAWINLVLASAGIAFLADYPNMIFVAVVSTFNLAWIGLVYNSIQEVMVFEREQRYGSITNKLATSSAKRFLKRNLNERHTWAATVGLKTTNFHIDHDPGGYMHSQLPASVMQIRDEEIQRCLIEVLGPMFLHSHVIGHRMFGAIDPEMSTRPCIDALKMFACLYLDASPLVERRIKGLTALLPIIDPGLDHILNSKELSTLIRRNLWFFHFDFGWIDQHVIHTPRNTKYDVRISTLSSRIRHSMLDYLEKTGGVGNFVWIGPQARERLLQEAPSMKNIIEPCPITGERGHDELLMFIIKFEPLIPRLQRYYDLDNMRKSLLDFEPSRESLRLQNIISLQIEMATTLREFIDAVNSIASVPWQGFKEKDYALQLILKAFNRASKQLFRDQDLQSSGNKMVRLRKKLLEAVRQIGYPSQILHDAQINKIALRDVEILIQVASHPRHPRFHEAWLLMSTNEYNRFSSKQRQRILEFVSTVPANEDLAFRDIVQVKTIDTLTSLARNASDPELATIAKIFSDVACWFAEVHVHPDVCALFLDGYTFMTTHLNTNVTLDLRMAKAIESYLTCLRQEIGDGNHKVSSIANRWREITAEPGQAA